MFVQCHMATADGELWHEWSHTKDQEWENC